MEKRKPPIRKYPGNQFFSKLVEKSGCEYSVSFIHGVVRGALANPFAVDPGAAMGEVFVNSHLEDLSSDDMEELTLTFLHLWNDTARSLSSTRGMPEALSSGIRTGVDESLLLFEAAELAEGYLRGFKLKRPPKGQRLPCARSWLRDLEGEGDWCRMMFENPEELKKTLPEEERRRLSIIDAVNWIEECMRWTVLYARADVKGTAAPGGGGSLARKSPCFCGSGKKYKRCCREKKAEGMNQDWN